MQRFYLDELNTINYKFRLKNKEIINQLLKVLRHKIWDKLILFDWKDLYDYIFEIKEISKKEIILDQISRVHKKTEIDFELNLFQAIPNKIDKIEFIIKNGTQIWISNFLFFRSSRSQKLRITQKKIERLNKIILESVEQSNRNIVPKLIIWDKINFANLKWENIFLHTQKKDSKTLKQIEIGDDKIVNIFVWPEGGFCDNEIDDFSKNSFSHIYLWERILRTELAWINSCFYIIQ